MSFKQYKRTNIAEMRPVTTQEINAGYDKMVEGRVSISKTDKENGSPKNGDMVARNPLNHEDQWLVAKDYFVDNFEEA